MTVCREVFSESSKQKEMFGKHDMSEGARKVYNECPKYTGTSF